MYNPTLLNNHKMTNTLLPLNKTLLFKSNVFGNLFPASGQNNTSLKSTVQ